MSHSYLETNKRRHASGKTYAERKKPIHIKKSEEGSLHREMGIPEGEKIGMARLEKEKAKAKREGNTKLERKVIFAENFGHKK